MRNINSKIFVSIFALILFAITPAFCQNIPKEIVPVNASAPAIPGAYSNSKINYIRTWEPDMPTSDTAVVKSTLRTPSEVKQSTEYYDGLGRIIQSVTKGISPAGNDAVSMNIYDPFGREVVKYLPYVPKTGNVNDGRFKTDPFNGQNAFYKDTLLNPAAAGESIYFARTIFESSPLNRIQKEYSQGNNWAEEGGNRSVQTSYQFNTISDSVRLFALADDATVPTSTTIYKAGTLFKNIVTDENNRQTISFVDKEGRKILERVQSSFAPGIGHRGWLSTYYIYNLRGQLAFILPPKAVDIIKASFSISTALAAELCFSYRYDLRGRIIEKKIPGAEPVEMAYDKRDRLVFSRNGLLKSRFQCQGYYYDSINRQIQYNVCNDTASVKTIQAVFDTMTVISQSPPLPFIPNNWIIPMSYTYYDKYNFPGASSYTTTDISASRVGSNSYPETMPSSASAMTKGLVVGKRSFVISDTVWLTTTSFYDDKGKVIQVNSDNWARGKDITNTRYDFSGKILSTYQRHTNPKSRSTPSSTLLTIFHYDAAGRPDSLIKTLNDNPLLQKVICLTSYDELGQKKNERFDVNASGQIETLNYSYNLKGWLKSINKNYLNTANSSSNWFGLELSYDNGFDSVKYDGNISGTKWKSGDDNISRAYGYGYDPVNRLISAYFTQQNVGSTTWTNTPVNFSVSGISYDASGNIFSMKQMGMNGPISQTIDSLKYFYSYGTNSYTNKLYYVTDKANNPASLLGDFHEANNTETQDYYYDPNGNICKDKNKNIDTIYYNDYNLPAIINIHNRGVLYYVYDGEGNKVGKVIIDTVSSQPRVVRTTYANGFVYVNNNNTLDTLQYINHEAGRIRPVFKTGLPTQWSFDYFLKDHLGNTRVILATRRDTATYAATMESSVSGLENALFNNIDNTRAPKPSYYPNDPTTNPNANVALLNGGSGGQKIGPSKVLRVMAGDTISVSVKAVYHNVGAATSANTSSIMVASILSAFSGNFVTDGAHSSGGVSSPINNLTSSLYDNLRTKDPDQNISTKPKAFLNVAAFDDNFNFVDENSVVKQVQGLVDSLSSLIVNKVVVKRTGFVYLYLSNESAQDVFFDNLIVVHNRGPLKEVTHYYPFGLTMAGISSHSLEGSLYTENKLKYNGIEFNEDFDLDEYDANFRTLDPQTGRWGQVDPKIDEDMERWSPYASNFDNPIRYNDPLGDVPGGGPTPGFVQFAPLLYEALVGLYEAAVVTGSVAYVANKSDQIKEAVLAGPGPIANSSVSMVPESMRADVMNGAPTATAKPEKAAPAGEFAFKVPGLLIDDKAATVKPENYVFARRGRGGAQAKLKEVGDDPKQGSATRGWIKQERNAMQRDRKARPGIRNPPGTELAHDRGKEAAKGYNYDDSKLKTKELHDLQHRTEKKLRDSN
ncbi:DUF6443 domain-containing protein [Chitinophaga sancti]|uniref:DUF6443 domain-containing protein n=1 Tax=Chitinophaga sancti TaxID=1004 RepID=A0A1K1STK0_9BACT|nr:DUF6443 domain-containing protein [Chitinophaga sancti]WQD65401.1 DUF6443 domain-containing protein [Chitinophaga sancti]WQG88975.1 DUF6443 domain-containing protein [Chitinophaga sancti]SFW87391.1 YD repeat-containing protein [Chitinophaga sancti]